MPARNRTPGNPGSPGNPGNPRSPAWPLGPAGHAAALALLAAALLTGAATPGEAGAQEVRAGETRRYDIPSGPLNEVLNRFATEAGVPLAAPGELTAGKTSAGLQGRYRVDAALQQLLTGTGLDYRRTESGGIRLVERETEQLAPIRVEGVGEVADGPVQGYRARRSATATRTDEAIENIPASVQVVPRDVIEDQQAFELREVLQNLPGVTSGEGSTLIEARETVFTRGFRSRAIYYDGFRVDALPSLDLVNIERTEVLKGPASIVAGQIEPGGLVNLVPQRPGRRNAADLGVRVGGYDFQRYTADLTAVTPEATAGGRLNAAVTDTDSFRDFVTIERETVAPSFRLDLGGRGRLELGLLHYDEERPFDEGVAFSADGREPNDVSTFLGGPDLDGSDFGWDGVRFDGDFDVSDRLTLRGGLFYQDFSHDWEAFRPLGDPGEAPPGAPPGAIADDEIFRFYDQTELDVETLEARVEALISLETGNWQHDVLVGANYRELERDLTETRGFDLADPATGEVLPQKININDPQFGDAVPTQNVEPGFLDGEQTERGLYLQDVVSGGPGGRWHLLGGLRYDEVEQDAVEERAQDRLQGNVGVRRSDQTDSEVTGRLGVLFRVSERWAPFVSYSQSFLPSGVKVSGDTGELLEATTGEQLEGGVKFSLPGDDLGGTLSVFRIDRDDVPIQDPDDRTRFVNGGEQRSEGVELSVSGTLVPSLQVLASAAYTDARWEESTAVEPDTRLRGTPKFSASTALRWTIPSGPLAGFELSGSVFWEDERPGDDADSFRLDSYAILNLGIARDWSIAGSTLRTAVTVKNVTDETYFVGSNSRSSVVPGEPQTAFASVSWRF